MMGSTAAHKQTALGRKLRVLRTVCMQATGRENDTGTALGPPNFKAHPTSFNKTTPPNKTTPRDPVSTTVVTNHHSDHYRILTLWTINLEEFSKQHTCPAVRLRLVDVNYYT